MVRLRILRDTIIAASLFFAVILASGFVFFVFEQGINPQVNSYWDGVWLAAATASSVGYGDVYPMSPEGRVLATILGFSGLSIIGATSALFTAYILEAKERKRKR